MKSVSCYKSFLQKDARRTLLLGIAFFTASSMPPAYATAADSYSKISTVTVESNKIALTQLFSQIEKQSEFLFFYVDNDVQNVFVKVQARNKNIDEVLNQALKGTGLTYTINNRNVNIQKVKGNTSINQQNRKVTGKVTDANGETIIGANIVEVGTTNGTVSDVNGQFSLNLKGTPIIRVTFTGYTSQDINTNGKNDIVIVMQENSKVLDEVVVVGFGTQKKVNLTGAVSTVNTKSLESRPVTNVSQALQGTVPGLNITNSSLGGQLGQTMNVNIRGTGTISTGSYAATLVLIDGIEGDMNNLNPDDIESISVLKDAAAASVYGSRAAFGVILITTKKGKAGEARITYSNNFRYSGPTNLPNLMNSYNFANYFNEASINGGGSAIFNDDTMNRIQQYMKGEITTSTIPNEGNGNWQFHEKANDNVNWYKVHYKWAWSQEHNLNIKGGTEKAQYYASAQYLDQGGNLRYGDDTYNRFNGMAKFNAKVNDFIDLNFNTKFTRSKLDNPYYSDMGGLLYHDIVRMWPMMPFKDPNGYYMRNGKLIQLSNGSRSISNTDNLNLQAQLVAHPLKNWNIYAEVGMNTLNQNKQKNLNAVYEHNVKGDPLALQYDGGHAAGTTDAYQTFVNKIMYTTSVYTNYSFAINDHSFKLMAGMNTEELKYRDLGAERPDLYTEAIPEINAAGGKDKITSADVYGWSTAGFFGRLNYDYKERYLLEANLRYDGSSRFLKEHRWATFPSFSFGWNIAREAFFENYIDIISILKPRVSWGMLGNQNTYSVYPFYQIQYVSNKGGNWLMNGDKPTVAYVPGSISPTLTWETIKTTDVGFDISMLRSRLNVNFDYYIRMTEDMVGPAAEIGATYGTSLPNTNNATLKNNGWEIAINWRDKIGNVSYNAGVNLSDNKVVVNKYPNASKSLSTYYNGMVMGEIWGYETEGIAKSNEEMTAWLQKNNPSWGSNWGEGDIMYRDLNNDGKVNSGSNTLNDPGDRKVIGNSTPRYRFGLTLGANWQGFDLQAFFQGVLKCDLWLSDPTFWGVGSGQWQSTGFDEHLNYYRPENTTSVFGPNTNAYYPKIYLGNGKNQYTQTRYLQNGAYVRLKNIQLGYTLPQLLLKKGGVRNVRLYCSAENILTFSHIAKMYDPESTGGPYGNGKTYPLSTTISFGVNITF